MKIVFVSAFINHHVLPICEAFIRRREVDFNFVAFMPIPTERLKIGYPSFDGKLDFVIPAYMNEGEKNRAIDVCRNCDVLITSGERPEYEINAVNRERLTFHYSERIFKDALLNPKNLLRAIKYILRKKLYDESYLLSTGPGAAADYNRLGLFKEKSFKWGYFPEIKEYNDLSPVIDNKRKNSIIWTGVMHDWKHPEIAVLTAEKLKEAGVNFTMDIVGDGSMKPDIERMVRNFNLENQVKMHGYLLHNDVLNLMKNSEIALITSNRREGWGAAVNECMGQACIPISYKDVGAAGYLIENRSNGIICNNNSPDEYADAILSIISDRDKRISMAHNAYAAVSEIWNADNAVYNFLKLIDTINKSSSFHSLPEFGPCSRV